MAPLINSMIRSSVMVMVLMGRLKTAPRQAQRIFCRVATACSTPMRLTPMTTKVTALVRRGNKPRAKLIPSPNSIKA